MPEYDTTEIERITNLTKNTRKDLVNYYAKLPETIKLEAHKLQAAFIRKNILSKKTKGKEIEFFYANFLIALQSMKNIETGQGVKKALTADEMKRIEMIRLSRIHASRKPKPSNLAVVIEIQFYELIRKLRNNNLSWRDISHYIERFHKKQISHSYLKKIYERLSRERTGGADEF